MTTDRIAQERRYSEFRYNEGNDKTYYGAAAAAILHENGWQFVPEQVRRANTSELLVGWWINPTDAEYADLKGDPKGFKAGAYATVALYTEVPLETIQQMATEFRQHDMKLMYSQTA